MLSLARGADALIIWVVWIGRRRAAKSCARDARPDRAALEGRHDLQRAMEELQMNLMEFSRDVEGRIDTRMKALEKLIADADERIKRLAETARRGARPGGPLPRSQARLRARRPGPGQDRDSAARGDDAGRGRAGPGPYGGQGVLKQNAKRTLIIACEVVARELRALAAAEPAGNGHRVSAQGPPRPGDGEDARAAAGGDRPGGPERSTRRS